MSDLKTMHSLLETLSRREKVWVLDWIVRELAGDRDYARRSWG